MIDPKRAVETEEDLLKKGSETIKLSKNGRLLGILGMVSGALGFTGAQGGLDGLGDGLRFLAGDNAEQTPSFLSQLLKLLGAGFGTSGGGLWVIVFGVAYFFYRNSQKTAIRRVEDHQQGWNTKY